MATIIDFTAKRQAALEAERQLRLEYEAEEELESRFADAFLEFEKWREHARALREKYAAAMAEKRARGDGGAS